MDSLALSTRGRWPRAASAIAAAALLLAAGGLAAQTPARDAGRDYPVRPITLVVPVAPGNTDVIARLFLQKITELAGWSFTYDYKPGAATTIGTSAVVRAAPDGYTMLMNSPNIVMAQYMEPRPSYDWRRDLRPVYQLTRTPAILVVNAALPMRSVKDYVAWMKANPGKLNFGTTGNGSISHLNAAWMHALMNVQATYVPYKGYVPVATAMLTGELDAANPTYKSFHAHITAGKLRALAITAANGRIRQLPELKSIAEEGYPEYDNFTWIGMFMPAATPTPIVNRMHAEFARASEAKDLLARLDDLGEGRGGGSIESFNRFLLDNSERLGKVIRDTGIRIGE